MRDDLDAPGYRAEDLTIRMKRSDVQKKIARHRDIISLRDIIWFFIRQISRKSIIHPK